MIDTRLSARRLLALTGAVALAAPLAAGLPAASAQQGGSRAGSAPRVAAHKVVAQGLNSPRLLSFGPGGALYVAEAGSGGTGPCATGGEGTPVCFGRTGSVTRIRAGHQHRVLRRLPSLASPGGVQPIGPEAVMVGFGGHYVVSMGAGVDLKARRSLGHQARTLGMLITGRFGGRHHRAADLVKWEWHHNPDHSTGHDSDPAGFAITRRGYRLTDAGGNDLLRVDWHGRIHRTAVFPTRMAALPETMGGGQVPMQAVPTAVTRGPDGAFYVSQLTGFPFPEGGSQIFRVVPGHAPTVWARGLTNVTDLAWSGRRLYAVEIAEHGLLSVPPGQIPTGALVRVRHNANRHLQVVARLSAPYGVAIRRNHAFVTTCSVCKGGGSVTRVALH